MGKSTFKINNTPKIKIWELKVSKEECKKLAVHLILIIKSKTITSQLLKDNQEIILKTENI